jgi:hypothetical protein
MPSARLLVVVHDIAGRPVEAKVEYRQADQRSYRALELNETLLRYVAKLEPGTYEVRVQGPEGTSEERRRVSVRQGDVHISVMVAEPGLPALAGPAGNWYFKTRDDERLLHVQGPGAGSENGSELILSQRGEVGVSTRHPVQRRAENRVRSPTSSSLTRIGSDFEMAPVDKSL